MPIDLDPAAQRSSPLLESLDAVPAPLGCPSSATVSSAPPSSVSRDGHADPARLAADGLAQPLADELVERDLCALGESLARGDLDVHHDGPVEAEALGERPHGGSEALVAQHDRLEVEREVAKRVDRLPLPLEGGREDLQRVVAAPFLDRMADRVEHQRDPGKSLHRAVVQKQGEPAALVLLGRDQLLEEADTLAFLAAPFALPPLERRVARRRAASQ